MSCIKLNLVFSFLFALFKLGRVIDGEDTESNMTYLILSDPSSSSGC